jgi:hypothetical protein
VTPECHCGAKRKWNRSDYDICRPQLRRHTAVLSAEEWKEIPPVIILLLPMLIDLHALHATGQNIGMPWQQAPQRWQSTTIELTVGNNRAEHAHRPEMGIDLSGVSFDVDSHVKFATSVPAHLPPFDENFELRCETGLPLPYRSRPSPPIPVPHTTFRDLASPTSRE